MRQTLRLEGYYIRNTKNKKKLFKDWKKLLYMSFIMNC